jgi:hypothetical protein
MFVDVLHVLPHARSACYAFMNRHVLLTRGKTFHSECPAPCLQSSCVLCDCPIERGPQVSEAEPSSNYFWTEIFLVPYLFCHTDNPQSSQGVFNVLPTVLTKLNDYGYGLGN